MMEREFDIILYGASGYTAAYIIRELEHSSLRIALSARTVPSIPFSSYPVISCQLSEVDGLAARTRLLINCAGPFTRTGQPIIRACIEAGTHYVDIAGETGYLRRMGRQYSRQARDRAVKVILACGFDSVPADMGAFYLCRFMDSARIDGTISAWGTVINNGTWNSLIHSLADHHGRGEAGGKAAGVGEHRAASTVRAWRYNRETRSYDVAYKGCDPYVVRRSARYFGGHGMCQYQYTAYVSIGSFWNLVLYYLLAFIFVVFSKFEWGRGLLTRFPGFFSNGLVKMGGPSDQQIGRSRFHIKMVADGTRNGLPIRRALTITGPDPAYISTAIFVTQCSYTLLEAEDLIDSGVLTPTQAFYRTRIIEKLSSRGIAFSLQDL